MSKRKKKEKHEEHADESWLLPYSDMLTLLLALFIVLFAASNVDAQKFQAMSQVFGEIFTNGEGIMEQPNTVPSTELDAMVEQKEEKEEKEDKQEQEELEKQQGTTEEQEANKVGNTEKEQLTAIQEKINNYIINKNLSGQLQTKLTDEGLLIVINDNVFFASGSASVRQQDIQIAQELSELLVLNPPRNIIISGHTDNVPIHNSNFQSNWELSVMRAVNFMKILLQNGNLDPAHFSAKGFGEHQPVASNDTNEGRAKNRRVEVLILPN
ncbi:flagellar motor protein MotB [Caldibacillus lycopersici]|uniref:Flagellar motor protein MotB n=1 Tax=Perspicuibacillus lycopersici TaxID=1325689 RepID=A0AAE3IS40_9BACI|nr:flagellar motor protein MotB [Perspicuibacillus lycopersici]MCU9612396.1 flagellar motor protein MotB [Perspicuibacillus lycopersici]